MHSIHSAQHPSTHTQRRIEPPCFECVSVTLLCPLHCPCTRPLSLTTPTSFLQNTKPLVLACLHALFPLAHLQYYFETIFPRIPKPVMDSIVEELKQRGLPYKPKVRTFVYICLMCTWVCTWLPAMKDSIVEELKQRGLPYKPKVRDFVYRRLVCTRLCT